MPFLNATSVIGQIINTSASDFTGSIVVSIFILMLILFAICFLLGIPIEFSMIIMIPLILSCMAYFQDFMVFGGIFIIYLALIMTKRFIFR